jgi:hypothetical protein
MSKLGAALFDLRMMGLDENADEIYAAIEDRLTRLKELEKTVDAIKQKILGGYITQFSFIGDTPIFLKERPKEGAAK